MLLALLMAAAAAPAPFTQVASVEGVTEYRLPNGLRVLFVPDESVATFTVNLTVLVGGRHEGYGEKGMAHLLEHLLFKGSPLVPDPKKALADHGGRWNGTTNDDRTNYFETLPASDANLEWALRFEADRLVNSFVRQEDLTLEMPVVRNEFELSETNARRSLRARVRGAAFPWHNYGRAVIGIRTDIEQVPIANLQAFYKRFYQPDTAVLVVAGRFNEAKALKVIAQTFGKLPRPARTLPRTFSREPAQDGERFVTVRRAGEVPLLLASWHVGGATDPDLPALMVLQGVLGDVPQGRLHQALVDGRRITRATCDVDLRKEPGLFSCWLGLASGAATAPARDAMLALLEEPKALPAAEVERAATGWISQMEQQLTNSEAVGLALSDWAALGDWRMLFVQRDRLKAVTAAEVARVWQRYLRPHNRTFGEYVPTEKPERVEIPPPPEVGPLVDGYRGGEALAKGEPFDPGPANIESRARRVETPTGLRLVLVPKKTRAQTVALEVELAFGTLESLRGQRAVAELTAGLLDRGTRQRSYQAFRDELARLRAKLEFTSDRQVVKASLLVRRPQLAEAIALLGEALREPALDAAQLDVVRGERLAQLEQWQSAPDLLGFIELSRWLTPYPSDHPLAVTSFPERGAMFKAVTVEQVRGFHADHFGAQAASIAVVGDFDDREVEQDLTRRFGAWVARQAYAPVRDAFVATTPTSTTVVTPDKANAFAGAGVTLRLAEQDDAFPALALAADLLGAVPSGRLFVSLRERLGLSYGAYAVLTVPLEGDRAVLDAGAIFAPANLDKAEAALGQELAGWGTLTQADLDHARKELLSRREKARADDAGLAKLLAHHSRLGRTLAWDAELERKLAALTPGQVADAVKKAFDPSRLSRIRVGDFKAGPDTAGR